MHSLRAYGLPLLLALIVTVTVNGANRSRGDEMNG